MRRIRLLKTITWSLTAFTITTVIGYLLTGSWIKGGTIGLLCRVIKVPTYYYHDLLYDRLTRKAEAAEPATLRIVPTCQRCETMSRAQ